VDAPRNGTHTARHVTRIIQSNPWPVYAMAETRQLSFPRSLDIDRTTTEGWLKRCHSIPQLTRQEIVRLGHRRDHEGGLRRAAVRVSVESVLRFRRSALVDATVTEKDSDHRARSISAWKNSESITLAPMMVSVYSFGGEVAPP
jgi:hypothetical protein